MIEVKGVTQYQDSFFKQRKTFDIKFRKECLKKLQKEIIAREDEICEALLSDFNKPKFESLATETQFVLAEIKNVISNLGIWALPKKVASSLSNFPSKDWIQFEPYGQVLVIAPWNYPFQLAISPLIGAIAAGNMVVLKPSELSPATSSVIKSIISSIFNENHVTVVEGGIEISRDLLRKKWDYIFFTGSTRVGKIVYKAAAKHLTPVTLELGGKNPCIIDATAPIKLTAKRIVWGKFMNAGQTCLAPDYLLVHHTIKDALVNALKRRITKSYGNHIKESNDFARIATKEQFYNLKKMLQSGKVVFGGDFEDTERYISPTIIENPALESKVMEGEIFGPILPILTYKSESEIDAVINHYGKPLGFYVFSKNTTFQKKMMSNYSFGGGVINDTVVHISNKRLPFGGVGNSGFGSYHGKHSFELFSHKKPIVKKANWLDLPFRYPPYRLPEIIIKKIKHLI